MMEALQVRAVANLQGECFPQTSSRTLSRPSIRFSRDFRIDSITQERRHRRGGPVRMAPDEEKMTRRSPLDFPVEWDRPRPGRRPDIFPQFSPMRPPLPQPLPGDPPEIDEDEEADKEPEEDPDKEPEQPSE
eukprot:TRINITY_DN35896_c0_g1_i1.p1 TRINITY_DN35896_c0_g1~~TRINITY_DN35896_c0_g1_i1.p1  ORF type:complete len:132 (+),score=21.49 TRINITY_DN35896_c0_g1_i1:162-557(+)